MDEKKTSKSAWQCALICFSLSLTVSHLPALIIGFILRFTATRLFFFHAWVSIAAPMVGFRNERLAAAESWLPGLSTRAPTMMRSLTKPTEE